MIALIAGQGQLPHLLASALHNRGQAFVVCGLMGQAPDMRGLVEFRLEHLGTLLASLGQMGVRQICFAGAVTRPQIDMAQIDAATLPLVPKIAAAMAGGDDGTLRVAIGLFEDAGFEVIAAPDILPALLPAAGDLTKACPNERDARDLARAQVVQSAMASVDIGQACIVAQGQVLAIETLQGTDWMMRSLMLAPQITNAPTSDIFSDPLGFAADVMGGPVVPPAQSLQRDPALPKGGVLFKAPKAGQDMRIDLPTIGVDTILRAAQLQLNGIAIGPMTQVLDVDAVVAQADRAGLFLTVLA